MNEKELLTLLVHRTMADLTHLSESKGDDVAYGRYLYCQDLWKFINHQASIDSLAEMMSSMPMTPETYYCAHTSKQITGEYCTDCNRLDCAVTEDILKELNQTITLED
jgi:hypothetical protein